MFKLQINTNAPTIPQGLLDSYEFNYDAVTGCITSTVFLKLINFF